MCCAVMGSNLAAVIATPQAAPAGAICSPRCGHRASLLDAMNQAADMV